MDVFTCLMVGSERQAAKYWLCAETITIADILPCMYLFKSYQVTCADKNLRVTEVLEIVTRTSLGIRLCCVKVLPARLVYLTK